VSSPLVISLCRSIVTVHHTRTPTIKRGKGVPATTSDIVHAVILWSERPEMMKKVLSQLPEVTSFTQEPKK
jgi:hypothetical protein